MVLTKDVKIEAVGLCGAVALHCFIGEPGCHALPVIYRQRANLGRRMSGTKCGKYFTLVVFNHGDACWAVGTGTPGSFDGAFVTPARTDMGKGVHLQKGWSFSSVCVTCLGDNVNLNTLGKRWGRLKELMKSSAKNRASRQLNRCVVFWEQ